MNADQPNADQPMELIERIRSVQFRPSRGVTGYDQGRVDDFLDGLVVALQQGSAVEPLVRMVQFPTTRMREGYWCEDVDDFLDIVVAESGGEPIQPVAEQVEPETTVSMQPPSPGVIEERRGWLDRFFGRR